MENFNELNFKKNCYRIIRTLKNAQGCKYYKNLFWENDISVDDIKTYEDFVKIPVLQKETYRSKLNEFIHDSCYKNGFDFQKYCYLESYDKISRYVEQYNLKVNFTSGTTGTPMAIFLHKKDLIRAYTNLNIYREKRVQNIIKKKCIWVWSNSIQYAKYNIDQRRFLKMHYGYKFFIYDFSDEEMWKVYNFILSKEIVWMICSPSFIYYFSDFLNHNNLNLEALQYIECQSEKLFDWQIEKIQTITSAVLSNIYSSNEVHFIGATCECMKMHQLSGNAFIEIENINGKNRVLLTNLSSIYMPLIRYEIGDCAEWDECLCDSSKDMAFKLLSYRQNDCLHLEKGKKIDFYIISQSITVLMQKFRNLNISQYQVVQTNYNRLVYKLLIQSSSKNYKASIKCFLESFLYQSLNLVFYVEVDIKDHPFVSNNGKFKCFISDIRL